MPHTDISVFPSQIAWLFLVFIFLYVFISKFFIPRISTALLKRKDVINKLVSEMEALTLEATNLEEETMRLLDSARSEAFELRKQAAEKAKWIAEDYFSKNKLEIESIVSNGQKEIVSCKQQLELQLEDMSQAIKLEMLDILYSTYECEFKSNN